jgi:hypothetical protein
MCPGRIKATVWVCSQEGWTRQQRLSAAQLFGSWSWCVTVAYLIGHGGLPWKVRHTNSAKRIKPAPRSTRWLMMGSGLPHWRTVPSAEIVTPRVPSTARRSYRLVVKLSSSRIRS